MNRAFFFLFTFLLSFIVFALPQPVWVFCPMCVATTGAGVGLFRWLGVDDTIIGLWVGGFIISASTWFNNYLTKRGKKIKLQLPIITAGFYFSTIILAYWFGFFINPDNKILGVNKLLLGIIVGSLVLISAFYLDQFMRNKNNGRVIISYQRIVIPISLLFIFSLIFYTITRGI